jgi:hypothetical protein
MYWFMNQSEGLYAENMGERVESGVPENIAAELIATLCVGARK